MHDHRNHLMKKRYFGHVVSEVFHCQMQYIVCMAVLMLHILGRRCRPNDSRKAAEDRKVKIFSGASEGKPSSFNLVSFKNVKFCIDNCDGVVQTELLPQRGAREPEGVLCTGERHGEESQSCCRCD